jgi:hypothetical protein
MYLLLKGDFDGIIGLSYPNLSEGENTIFDEMVALNLLENPIFSFYLDQKGEGLESHIIFGGYEENLIAEGTSINWVPVK